MSNDVSVISSINRTLSNKAKTVKFYLAVVYDMITKFYSCPGQTLA
jgi:hypothetical protein